MVGWELPPHNSGGLGEACYGLSKALVDKGVQVTFVLPKKVDLNIDFMQVVFADIANELSKIPTAYEGYQAWLKSKKIGSFNPSEYIKGALFYGEKMGEIAKAQGADVIHAHDWLTFPAGTAAKIATKKPLVAHVHATEFDRTGGNFPNPVVYNIEKEGLEKADRVIPVSRLTQSILMDKYGLKADKIDVVYNGVGEFHKLRLMPALETYKANGYKIVLFLGRITLQKGPDYFIQAARKVLKFDKKVLFVVTGSGDMQDVMLQKSVEMGIIKNMVFTGFLRGEERDRMFQAADLYIMPSVSEPFGITPLESIANGTPVLVSKQSGVSEVLSHALKTDFWDIDEMANKILVALRYKALRDVLLTESSRELTGINWQKAADKVLSIYRSLSI